MDTQLQLTRDDIWVDPAIMPAHWTHEQKLERQCEAESELDRGFWTGEWPLGRPVVSDRGSRLGPEGERYVLLGFDGKPSLSSPDGESYVMLP